MYEKKISEKEDLKNNPEFNFKKKIILLNNIIEVANSGIQIYEDFK